MTQPKKIRQHFSNSYNAIIASDATFSKIQRGNSRRIETRKSA
jgi:hypothetical protein